jgi:hypothetical protein
MINMAILKRIKIELLNSVSFIVISRTLNNILLPDLTMELQLYSTMHQLKRKWSPLRESNEKFYSSPPTYTEGDRSNLQEDVKGTIKRISKKRKASLERLADS